MIYVFVKKRHIDYFTLLSFSTVIYYFPLMLGTLISTTNSNSKIPINQDTYLSINVFLSLLLVLMYISDNRNLKFGNIGILKDRVCELKTTSSNSISNFSVLILEIIGLLMVAFTIRQYGSISGSFNKVELLFNSNRIIEYYKYISLFVFVYSFITSGKYCNILRAISVILIAFTFYLGHRSFFLLGIIGILLCYLGRGKKVRLIDYILRHKLLTLFTLVLVLVMVFVKGVFAALMSSNYELVISRLSDPNYYVDTILSSESNAITNNINNVTSSNFSYSIYDYILNLLMLVPFFGGYLLNDNFLTFEQVLNQRFNPYYSQGIGSASTFIGESYAIGKLWGVFIQSFLLMLAILFLQRKLFSLKKGYIVTFLSVILPYLAFYIHRLSVINLLVTIRAYLYILILVSLIRVIIKSITIAMKS